MIESEIDILRKTLYSYAFNFEAEEDVGESFQRDFSKLLEYCTLSMMQGSDNFFGIFMLNLKREVRIHMKEPIATLATISGFTMYFNPKIFLEYDLKQMRALIKHEIYHIMYSHHRRIKSLYKEYCREAVNIAMDISVNQYIGGLPSTAIKIEWINKSYGLKLEYNESLESYAAKINEVIEKRPKKEKTDTSKDLRNLEASTDLENMHSLWVELNDKINDGYAKSMIKKIACKSNKGEIPQGLDEALSMLNYKAEIDWISYLRLQVSTMAFGYKKTIMRRNRRQPERSDLRGRLRNHVTKILVAIDVSASMTDEGIHCILKEILFISKSYPIDVRVLECDNEIRRIYKIDSITDIKKKLERKGSTSFSPVFEYIYKEKLSDYILIYFTDGMGEDKLLIKPINFKTLWVLCGEGDLSLEKSYGEIKRLKLKKAKEENIGTALEMYRESSDIHNRVHM